jgi:hypothetical protein
MSDQAPEATDPNDALLEELFWSPLRGTLELDTEQSRNLICVVGLHLVLDRLLTLNIVTRLCSGGGTQGIVETMTEAVADLSFGRRLEMVARAGWVAADVIVDLREVNRVRNRLLHFDPRRKRFEGVPELVPPQRFESSPGADITPTQGLWARCSRCSIARPRSLER